MYSIYTKVGGYASEDLILILPAVTVYRASRIVSKCALFSHPKNNNRTLWIVYELRFMNSFTIQSTNSQRFLPWSINNCLFSSWFNKDEHNHMNLDSKESKSSACSGDWQPLMSLSVISEPNCNEAFDDWLFSTGSILISLLALIFCNTLATRSLRWRGTHCGDSTNPSKNPFHSDKWSIKRFPTQTQGDLLHAIHNAKKKDMSLLRLVSYY